MINGCIRTVILFGVTAVVLRLMGKRQLAQLQPYEVVITLMISDLATLPMGDVELPLMNGVVAILTLLLVHSVLSVLAFSSMRMRRIICGRPSVLIRNGRICQEELARLCFDLSDLMEGIRAAGLSGPAQTGSAILETNGTLSVFPLAEERPATRKEQGLPPMYDGIPLTLILDGCMQKRTMRILGKEPQWLEKILETQGITSEKDVLIAALDTQGVLMIQEKGERGRLMKKQVMETGEVCW